MTLQRMKSQMHADNRQENSLDVLQGMINGILIETGKALRASSKAGGKSAAQSAIRLRTSIPGTINEFHLALDELEADIVRAQAVLARDLGELRAKNPVAEPVVNTEEESAALPNDAQDSNTNDVVIIDDPEPFAISAGSKLPNVNQGVSTPETKATNLPTGSREHDAQQPTPRAKDSDRPENTVQTENRQKQEIGAEPTAIGIGTVSNDVLNASAPAPAPASASAPAPAPPPAPTAPDTADLSLDMIFDGIDMENGSKPAAEDLNFDSMDFTVGENGGQDMQLDNTASGDLDALMFGDTSGENNNDNPENVASLLPGLENYANADNSQDFDMSSFLPNDQPNESNKKGEDPVAGAQDETKPDANDDLFGDFGGLANESNFDELLDGMDFGDGADDNGGGEMMGSNEEFDNAFFGIE